MDKTTRRIRALLDKAEYLIAELNPAVRDRIKAHDYQANPQAYKESQQAMAQHMHEYPSPERVEAHIATTLWLDDHQRAAGKYPEKSTRRPGYWSSEPWHVQSTESDTPSPPGEGWVRARRPRPSWRIVPASVWRRSAEVMAGRLARSRK